MKRVIIAAGGTGGHIMPALAIGEEIRSRHPQAEILFVGTNRGLEQKVIPAGGFRLKTIVSSGWIRGWSPVDVMKNMMLPFKLLFGMLQSLGVLATFRPQVVVGCGGYVSGPVVLLAAWMGKRIVVQEQNSRPGRTTLLLSRWADELHVAYEDSMRFFKDRSRVHVSGNPIRKGLRNLDPAEGRRFFGLDPASTTLFVLGGSLGARAINTAMIETAPRLVNQGTMQVLWQTGPADRERVAEAMKTLTDRVLVLPFIDRMSEAYSAADLVLCRAGAMTLSEITLLGRPAVLVPYPYAADRHQDFNAASLVSRGAALMIRDGELNEKLAPMLLDVLGNRERLKSMGSAAYAMRQPEAAKRIVDGLERLVDS